MSLSQNQGDNVHRLERFRIRGDVGAPGFPGWITRHAQRLGLSCRIVSQADDLLEVTVAGPGALVDAMALGCSLGPREVMVDEVQRQPANDAA